MKIQDLKNYGMSVAEASSSFPKELRSKMKKETFRMLLRNLGILGTLRFLRKFQSEEKRLKQHEYKVVRERKLTADTFIQEHISAAATFSALVDVVGEEKAVILQKGIIDKFGYELMESMVPSVRDLEACGDRFTVFKAYMKACNAANVKCGVHCIEEIEDTPDVYRFNVKACAYHSIPQEVGLGATCL